MSLDEFVDEIVKNYGLSYHSCYQIGLIMTSVCDIPLYKR